MKLEQMVEQLLAEVRKTIKKGRTFTEVAEKTGYSRVFVSLVARGKREPSLEFIRKLSNVRF